jgi:hypothetical protein
MLFARINRDKAEKVFGIFKNAQGSTITANYCAVWDASSTADGNRVTKPATATLSLFIGIATQSIADGDYGKFQLYGYRASAFVTNNTSQAVAAGDILIPVDAVNHLARSGASDGKSGFVFAAAAVATATTPAAAAAAVFLRAL